MAMPATGGADERAVRFEAMFAACSREVFAYARRRATREEAEEVVSETFLVAWRRFDELSAEPLPWLIAVARHVLANRRRSDNRRRALSERLGSEPDRPVVPDDSWTPAQRVRAALAVLPAGEREVIRLLAWEGLSPAEVARVLEISRATVYVRLHRARQRLARALEEER